MANNILDFQKKVTDLDKVLSEHIANLSKVSGAVGQLNNTYAKLPSQYIENQERLNDLTAKEAASKRRVIGVLNAESRERIQLNRELVSQKRTKAQLERIEERELRRLRQTQGLYNQVNGLVKRLTVRYNDLALKKRLNNNLTDRETRQLVLLEKQLNRYRGALKQVDTNIGDYRRNVGNYGSAWNGLGNSLNQLTREAPAFANSLQTGFLAISNNIPILVDEINNLNVANKNLIAQGKPVQSVLRQIAGALFSWQTALSVGVTLLTIYGDEIVEWIGTLFKANEEVEKLALTQERLNEINEKAAQNASKQVAELGILAKSVTNVTSSQEDREDALNRLQELYPEYFSNLDRETASYEDIQNAVRGATNELIKQGLAKAVIEELSALGAKRLELLRQTETQLQSLGVEERQNAADLAAAREEFQQLNALLREGTEASGLNNDELQRAQIRAAELARTISTLQGAQSIITAQEGELLDERVKGNREINRESALLSGLINQHDLLSAVLGDTAKGYREVSRARGEEQTIDPFATTTTGADEEFAVPSAAEAEAELLGNLERIRNTARAKELSEQQMFADRQVEIFQGLFSTFSQLYNVDVQAFTKLFDSKKNTTDDYVNAAVEAANFILNVSRENFDLERQANQDMLDNVLNSELASEEQKQIAREEFEKRERQIRIKQARAERNATLIQIGIDTAAGIARAVAESPLTFGLPFAAIVAATGAAQAAFVASQPLPQFAEGTDNAPEGWAWTQEKGSEIITDKDGNLKTLGSNKGAQLTYLNKGDKVFKHGNEDIARAAILTSLHADNYNTDNLDAIFDKNLAKMGGEVKKGVKDGLKGFKNVNRNNVKVDIGHSLWLKSKGY